MTPWALFGISATMMLKNKYFGVRSALLLGGIWYGESYTREFPNWFNEQLQIR